MELSWLKRQLRQPGYPPFEDAQRLLDALDRVYEDAQEYETILLHGEQDINPYTEMSRFVKENAGILVHVLLGIPSVGMQGVLDAMIASKGYEGVLHELEEWRMRPREIEIQDEKFLQDLGDHPF
jgi:hypothetical protein